MSRVLKSFVSIALGGALAFALAIVLRDYPLKRAVPAIFVLVLILIAYFAGRLASLLAAFVGGVIFAVYLFEPYGSIAVASAADRIVLCSFAVLALVLTWMSPQANRNRRVLSGVEALIERNEVWIALGTALLSLLAGIVTLFFLFN